MIDFKRFRFGKYGVEGLAWPFPMQTIDEFSEKFFISLENFKRECIPANAEIKDAFDVSLIYIILDTASLYQAAILAEKNKMLGGEKTQNTNIFKKKQLKIMFGLKGKNVIACWG